MALPLVVSALKLKLSSVTCHSTQEENSIPLEVYQRTMECFSEHYDTTKAVSSTMDRILSETEAQFRQLSMQQQREDSSLVLRDDEYWYDVFVQQPKLHLRVAMAVDLSFSLGKFPEDEDFPTELRVNSFIDLSTSRSLGLAEALPWDTSYVDEISWKSTLVRVGESMSKRLCPVESLSLPAILDFMDFCEEEYEVSDHSVGDDPYFDDGGKEDNVRENWDEQAWELWVMDLFDQIVP